MTAVMRSALPRLSASMMMKSSMYASFGSGEPDWITYTSLPRTPSITWQNVSPSGKCGILTSLRGLPRYSATFSASGRLAVPENTMNSSFIVGSLLQRGKSSKTFDIITYSTADLLHQSRRIGRELLDRRPVAVRDGVFRRDPGSPATGDFGNRKVIRDVRELHAARGHDLDSGPAQRAENVLDVRDAARRFRREELHHSAAETQGLAHFAGRRRAGAERHAELVRGLDEIGVEARGDARFGPGGLGGDELVEADDGSGDKHRARDLGLDLRDRGGRTGRAEGDLENGKSALHERSCERHGLFDVVNDDHRDDSGLCECFDHVHFNPF